MPPTLEDGWLSIEDLGCTVYDYTGDVQTWPVPDDRSAEGFGLWIEVEGRGGSGDQDAACIPARKQVVSSPGWNPWGPFPIVGPTPPAPWFENRPGWPWGGTLSVQVGGDGAGATGGWPDGGDGGFGIAPSTDGFGAGGSSAFYNPTATPPRDGYPDAIDLFWLVAGTGGGSGSPGTLYPPIYYRERPVPGGGGIGDVSILGTDPDTGFPIPDTTFWDGIDFAVWHRDYAQGKYGRDDLSSWPNAGRAGGPEFAGGFDGETPTEVSFARTTRGGRGGDGLTWDDFANNTGPGDPRAYPIDPATGERQKGTDEAIGGGGGGGGWGGGGGGAGSLGYLDPQPAPAIRGPMPPLYPVLNPTADPTVEPFYSTELFYTWGGGMVGNTPYWVAPGTIAYVDRFADNGQVTVCAWWVELPTFLPAGNWHVGRMGFGASGFS